MGRDEKRAAASHRPTWRSCRTNPSERFGFNQTHPPSSLVPLTGQSHHGLHLWRCRSCCDRTRKHKRSRNFEPGQGFEGCDQTYAQGFCSVVRRRSLASTSIPAAGVGAPNLKGASKVTALYNWPLPRLRSLLCVAQRSFPLCVGAVPNAALRKDRVSDFETFRLFRSQTRLRLRYDQALGQRICRLGKGGPC